jgi:predicted pyridoxine 5'-phosphate oxidase superfamily flavin-nucleotide-binding protein
MGHRFAELAFTDRVKQYQEQHGSRASYARMEGGIDLNDRIGPREAEFLGERDSFYMATVSATGWPYVQHRGGPAGFLKVLDDRTIGFADFRGNRQYVSVGNLDGDNRVSLILVDYAGKKRLKIMGRVTLVADDHPILAKLQDPEYRARVERAFVITVEAFDWNCPQHITPRFSAADVDKVVAPLQERIAELERQLGQSAQTKDGNHDQAL